MGVRNKLFTVQSAPWTLGSMDGGSYRGGNEGGRGRKSEEETPVEGV